jgi:hypothetical protein
MRLISPIIICIILCAFWFSECKNAVNSPRLKEYPDIVSSNNLREFYDTAKLYLYSYHCDIPFDPIGIDEKNLYFSYLDLPFDTLIKRGDTVEILFNFVYRGTIVDDYRFNNPVYVKNGIAFDLVSKKKIYMTTTRNLTLSEVGASSRYVNPLQPDVVDFVRTHARRINPWYKCKLEKLGVLQ